MFNACVCFVFHNFSLHQATTIFHSHRTQRHRFEEYIKTRQEKEWVHNKGQKSYGDFYQLKSASQIHFATGNTNPLPQYLVLKNIFLKKIYRVA
jgi:hypothetical protein